MRRHHWIRVPLSSSIHAWTAALAWLTLTAAAAAVVAVLVVWGSGWSESFQMTQPGPAPMTFDRERWLAWVEPRTAASESAAALLPLPLVLLVGWLLAALFGHGPRAA